MARVKFKLNIRSVKDAEGARKLYNLCIFHGYYRQALDIAATLWRYGYAGWDHKMDQVLELMRRGR